jgi:hypothetical protein
VWVAPYPVQHPENLPKQLLALTCHPVPMSMMHLVCTECVANTLQCVAEAVACNGALSPASLGGCKHGAGQPVLLGMLHRRHQHAQRNVHAAQRQVILW